MNSTLFAPGFKTSPWWWEAAEPPERSTPLPDHAPVAVIGGGYAGLSAALSLARLGHKVTVLDAERIGWGASSRNGGMVSGGLKVARTALAEKLGAEQARNIAMAAAASFPFIEETIAREGIECDYTRCGRFVAAWTPKHYDALARQADYIAEITGLPTEMLPPSCQHEALGSDHYRGGMKAAATLVDYTRVAGIRADSSGFRIATNRGELRADAVLVATNGYSRGADGKSAMPWLARRMIPVASYIIATEELPAETMDRLFPGRRMISDTKRVLNYFRPAPYGNRILWGGRARFGPNAPEAAAPRLHSFMTAVFPELSKVKITHAWTGNVAFTFDFLPHIGVQDGIHYAAGCQGSGVAMATWLGHNAALKIAGAANQRFALDGLEFPTVALYNGNPNWFLPIIGGWYRLRDRIDRIAA
jgi:glycine/D-amino acid oxidase-like deaminating enzyme